MRKFAFSRLAAATVLSLGLSTAANAAVTDLGVITLAATPFSGFALGSDTFFQDVFLLELPANLGSSYTIMNLPLDLGATGTLGTTFFSMSLVDSGPDMMPFTADDVELLKVESVAGASVLSLSLPGNPGGVGYIGVVGMTTGSLGGIYNGAIAVTPVPEPETWAMLALGLGLVAMRVRRRSSDGERLAVD